VGHLGDNTAYERQKEQLKVTVLSIGYTNIIVYSCTVFCCIGHTILISLPVQSGLNNIFNGVILKNNEAMEALLQEAIDSAVRECTIIISC